MWELNRFMSRFCVRLIPALSLAIGGLALPGPCVSAQSEDLETLNQKIKGSTIG